LRRLPRIAAAKETADKAAKELALLEAELGPTTAT
jgi:hypothetical protein